MSRLSGSTIQIIVIAFLFLIVFSCREEKVEDPFKPTADHASYLEGLDKMNLLNSALGSDWKDAAKEALEDPLSITLPHREDFYLPPSGTSSFGYLFTLEQGQRIEIKLDQITTEDAHLFMDVFRKEDNGNLVQVASKDENSDYVEFEVRRRATYVLRIQPELLRGGKYELMMDVSPSLAFPVEGKSRSAIHSFFGDPRDGGRRKHHGVDIFARRNTPIIAPTEGSIRFAGTRGLGGRVVWMHDTQRDQTLYFAHLEKILVDKGQRVSPGDTIGTVGNSGNARTTPPHLHFGIYQSGPQDPFHYIAEVTKKARKVWGTPSKLGLWMRTSKKTQLLDSASGNQSDLVRHQVVQLEAASSYSYRVVLPDGRKGYIRHTDLEEMISPVARQGTIEPIALLDKPIYTAPGIKEIAPGIELEIHGYHDDYVYVSDNTGTKGWVIGP